MVITQNGEAKAVLQDVASFEETQETLDLLKILALGNQDVSAGKVKPVADVVARLRTKGAQQDSEGIHRLRLHIRIRLHRQHQTCIGCDDGY